jgi:regulatory protein
MTEEKEFIQHCSWAMTYCSRAEKCSFDVRKKLTERNVDTPTIEKVIQHLKNEKFIDDLRYAQAFTREKFKISKWGKIKIKTMLIQKKIDNETIKTAFEEINADEYQKVLSEIISKKRKTIKDSDSCSVKSKLIRFAGGRGFEPELIFELLS